MKKHKWNLFVDVLLFFLVMAKGGIGLLIKYVLIPGIETWEVYKTHADLYFLGMDRHQWGAVHLILGYIFLGLLVLHIILHWKQIKAMIRNLTVKKGLRAMIWGCFIILGSFLILFSFFISPEVDPVRKGGGRRSGDHERIEESSSREGQDPLLEHNVEGENHDVKDSTIEVFGNMTLGEVGMKFHVPTDSLKKHLGLPASTSDGERLGRLRRIYNFHMSDIERYIEQYK